jgi:hypothetical protein
MRARREAGFATVFTLTIFLTLLLFAGLVLDGGLALAGKVTALDEAQQAARAGAQALDLGAFRASGTTTLSPQAAITAAQDYLAHTGDTGTVQVTGESVTVSVTHAQHTQLLCLAGLNTITVHAAATATAEQTN